MLTKTEIEKILTSFNINLSDSKLQTLFEYYLLIEEKNKVMNLTGFHNEKLIIEGFIESYLLLKKAFDLSDPQKYKLLDIGAGVGFPSVPYLIMTDKNIELTIIEPLKKRCIFLNHISDTLKLNINVINDRAENVKLKNEFDLVTARAVMELKYLVEVSCQLGKINSQQVFIKGSNIKSELDDAKAILKLLNLKYLVNEYKTEGIRTNNLVYIFKTESINPKFPRSWNTIIKK
ncbi:16S rRNA (guanine(527)-N(7))-methyltransferase RsmG [Mycoplasma zalophi]|uniref:Ribosomal RNA small subunit methyltransferase G n=1 Tax=Mycoplasma zalophi TaxID=191287 RepID=A0ABS6DP32_9MOLU|nr:16S rRNA (guanine(527)-N(7))-methyltransferase RsmG [Mycoplasma zalophi]MBU4691143.1 16S rRNA (guanine(527)-N(7))-methyltransferase RsmG [Mycoplasma zalophi]MBU4692085.1 16S rRNA (guanine(527)-N(7))-methyltransferase RsmG [Mycoplasma zalophi]